MIEKQVKDFDALYRYYQTYCQDKTQFVVLSNEEFSIKLIENKICLISYENDKITGFLSGVVDELKGYITLTFGRVDVVKLLVKAFEQEMCKQQIQEIWIHFFNPVQLSWYPLPKVVHPGVQGVDRDSFLYPMYRELGYQNHSLQETYYLKLTEYKEHCIFYPNKSLSIDFYNSKIHKSLDPYTKKMKEKHWASVLLQNAEQVKPLPLLVALEDRQIIGFAGPLKVQENGRGYFAGIGILEEYRGQKLGKYLFNNLCQSLKDMGARYMTLFTGQNNVAKHIYLNTGFVVVKRFMTMKKTI